MPVKYERLVAEDLNRGYGTTVVTMPSGGTATGNKLGLHTFTGWQNPIEIDGLSSGQEISESILSALGRANASTGALTRIVIPPGAYTIGQKVSHAKGRIVIDGGGPLNTTLTLANGVNDHMFAVGDGTTYTPTVMFSNLSLIGNGANQSQGSGIKFYGVEQAIVVNCHIYGFKDNGVVFEGSLSLPTTYMRLNGCYVNTNLTNGVIVGPYAYGLRAIDNVFAGNGQTGPTSAPVGYGMYITSGDNHQVLVNQFDENGHGLFADLVSDCIFNENCFQQQRGSGILLGPTLAKNLTVSHNMLLSCGMHDTGDLENPIYFGIYAKNVTKSSFKCNQIRSAVNQLSHGIREDGASNDNTITGNPIEDALVPIERVGAQTIVRGNPGFISENGGTAEVADGGTIAHGINTGSSGLEEPEVVQVTGTVAGEIVTCTVGPLNITVAIKKHDGTAGTTQDVSWRAYKYGNS